MHGRLIIAFIVLALAGAAYAQMPGGTGGDTFNVNPGSSSTGSDRFGSGPCQGDVFPGAVLVTPDEMRQRNLRYCTLCRGDAAHVLCLPESKSPPGPVAREPLAPATDCAGLLAAAHAAAASIEAGNARPDAMANLTRLLQQCPRNFSRPIQCYAMMTDAQSKVRTDPDGSKQRARQALDCYEGKDTTGLPRQARNESHGQDDASCASVSVSPGMEEPGVYAPSDPAQGRDRRPRSHFVDPRNGIVVLAGYQLAQTGLETNLQAGCATGTFSGKVTWDETVNRPDVHQTRRKDWCTFELIFKADGTEIVKLDYYSEDTSRPFPQEIRIDRTKGSLRTAINGTVKFQRIPGSPGYDFFAPVPRTPVFTETQIITMLENTRSENPPILGPSAVATCLASRVTLPGFRGSFGPKPVNAEYIKGMDLQIVQPVLQMNWSFFPQQPQRRRTL